MPTYPELTKKLKKIWDRNAGMYDLMSLPMEHMMGFGKARAKLFEDLTGRVLEVGVGTGRNIPYYPGEVAVAAIDISKNMLSKAKGKAKKLSRDVSFEVSDVEDLSYADSSFDAVVATGVFCCVPDQVRGFKELKRVLKEDGKIILLEHIRPGGLPGRFFDFLDPLVHRLMGLHINRRTLDSIKEAGLTIIREENIFSDWVKLVVAK